MSELDTTARCALCLKNRAHCRYLIHSEHANVCDECVELGYKMLLSQGVISRWRLVRLFFS